MNDINNLVKLVAQQKKNLEFQLKVKKRERNERNMESNSNDKPASKSNSC